MEQVGELVVRAATAVTLDERVAAYGQLVERFRDMACGYAYSILGDFHLAEDAAQEAFVTAYQRLDQLREPEAYPGWFRSIVWTTCGQISRRKAKRTAPLESAKQMPSQVRDPSEMAEAAEMRDEVLRSISQLPDPEREVTTLFYINGYSQKDIADFLEVPVGTVKNRLTASRSRLKRRMLNMVKDTLHQNAPDERFDKKVINELLSRPRPLTIPGHPIRQVWEDFKTCFPGAEEVDFDEVVSRQSSHLTEQLEQRVGYVIDETSVLRTGLTGQLLHHWRESGGGERTLITAGRTFRKGTLHEPQRVANLFHQAEILQVVADMTDDAAVELARQVVLRVVGKPPTAFGEPVDLGGGVMGREIDADWRGQQLEVGVAGYYPDEVIHRSGLNPKEYRALCLCLGLERCALVRYSLDDIRKLWQSPYVT